MRKHQVDRDSRVPPSRQIADWLRAEIETGAYTPKGPALPSITTLTMQWGVARVTANKALKLLAAEGLIEVEEGMGYYLKQ